MAFVQGGPGLEAVELQVDRLKRLAPDRYHIEATPTGPARQRLVELLDSLTSCDELCIASLAPLRLEVGEAAQLIFDLVDRGVRVVLVDERNSRLDVGRSSAARSLLEAFAGLHRRLAAEPNPKTSAAARGLLTGAEIEDIRRLHDAGLSPRRIGLIYRRSPKCISEIIWGVPPVGAEGVAGAPARATRPW
ncbi:MAG TPA: recombinase family protein [Phenylobacterium sp.]|nr:recombinase family protein [Phenylobacterium sp.]